MPGCRGGVTDDCDHIGLLHLGSAVGVGRSRLQGEPMVAAASWRNQVWIDVLVGSRLLGGDNAVSRTGRSCLVRPLGHHRNGSARVDSAGMAIPVLYR